MSALQQILLAEAAAGVAAVTWSATNKTSTVTLSNGNLTATSDFSGNPNPGRCDTSISGTQRAYWELTQTFASGGAGLTAFGFCNASFASFTAGTFIGGDANSLGYGYGSGQVFVNNVVIATIAAFVSGDVLCFAADANTRLLWIRDGITGLWNNDILANQNPAVGSQVGGIPWTITGAVFPLYGIAEASGTAGVVTGALSTGFAGTPPSGFSGV